MSLLTALLLLLGLGGPVLVASPARAARHSYLGTGRRFGVGSRG